MSDKQKHVPPKWADKLLEWYCRPEHLEEVQGALHEYFTERAKNEGLARARLFFVLDALGHFRPHLIKIHNPGYSLYPTIMLRYFLRTSLRNLVKHKLNSTLNIVGLTIGITCFMMIMIWVNHEKGFDGFHEKSDRIYRISNTFRSESEQFSQAVSGPALGAQLHKLFPQIANAVRCGRNSGQIKVGNDNYFENDIGIVDPSFLDIFDFKLLAGNKADLFTDIHSIVITASTAEKYFGNEGPIGKMVVLDEQTPMKVTGVLADPPSNSQLRFDMLIPMGFAKDNWSLNKMDDTWGGGWFHTYLLLEKDVDVPSLEKEVNKLITTKLTWFTERNMSYEYFLQPLKSIHLESNLRYDFDNNGSSKNVMVFTIVAFIVLFLACINYINLTTANAVKRAKETGIKKVIGALRSQLIWQHLGESVLMAFMAALISVGLVYLLMPLFESFLGHQVLFTPDRTIVIALFAGVVGLGFFAGLLPAFITSSFQPLKVIKGQLTRGKKGAYVRNALVMAQFTATIALTIAIITVNRQMSFIQQQALGMETDEVVLVSFRGIQSVRDNRKVLKDRLLENAAIKAVSFQRRAYPVGGLSNGMVMVETGSGNKVSSSLYHMWVDFEYANTFGMEIVAGRFYSQELPSDTLDGVVVNEAAVASFGWGEPENAIGKEMGDAPDARKVIGVVKDFNFEGLHKRVEPVRILPVANGEYTTMAIRANLSRPFELLGFLESTWMAVNPNVPLDYSFMNEDIQNQYEAEYKFRTIFLFFSSLSMVIACLGLFGLATAATNQRIKEIGIRKIMGASVTGLIQLISRNFMVLVLISLFLATPIAWYGMEQWLNNFAYRIDIHWGFIALAGLIATVVSLLTVSYQAIKAALSNPTKTLRHE